MKAVIMETKNGYACALTDNGQFVQFPDNGYAVGATVELTESKPSKKRTTKPISRIYAACLATAAAILISFMGLKDFNTPYSTVTIDVNPSIEISVNRYDKVLNIEAVNEDAETIVNEVNSEDVKYQSLDTATNLILEKVDNGNYQTEEGTTYVVLSATSKDDDHAEKIVNKLETVSNKYEDINAQVIKADDDLVERAKEAGTTPGKMYLVDRVKETVGTDQADEKDLIQKPVSELVKEIGGQKPETEPSDTPDEPMDKPDEKRQDQESLETPPPIPDESISNPDGESKSDIRPDKPDNESQSDERKKQDFQPNANPDSGGSGNGGNAPGPAMNPPGSEH